jgi:hypothetical protein
MKITSKAIISLLLAVIMLTSCNSFLPTQKTQPTQAMETALAIVRTAIAETQTAIPTATVLPSVTPPPTFSPLPPRETPIPTSALSFSSTPTVIPLENGLTWSECVMPSDDAIAEGALGFPMEIPRSCIGKLVWNENDKNMVGERVKSQDGSYDLRITIGKDHFETRHDNSKKPWTYELVKNGEVILEMSPGFYASDPNRKFWNIDGKLVWELAGWTKVIVVDGVDYNQSYQLEGSFFPYEIRGKLIYIAKKNGTFHIVYDNKVVEPEFDSVQLGYCCEGRSVGYGGGQYWFFGTRAGTNYLIFIH